jgi:pimeloyl-ACP methyl ester carboxylesterase
MPLQAVNGQNLYYTDTGGDKPCAVFLHGFLFDGTMFDGIIAELKADYRCITVDTRAFGQTEWDGEAFTLYDTAADVVGLLDALDIKQAVFVGMSQGGYGIARIALKYPDYVTALVFTSTHLKVDSEDVKGLYRSMRDTWVENGPAPLVGTFLDLFIGEESKFPELRKTWQAKWEQVDGNHITHSMNHLIDRDELSEEQVAALSMPAMVIHGEDDRGIPLGMGKGLYEELPNAKTMFIVPGAQHGAMLTHPEAIADPLKAFLADVTS